MPSTILPRVAHEPDGSSRHGLAVPAEVSRVAVVLIATLIVAAACSKSPEQPVANVPHCTGGFDGGPLIFYDAAGVQIKTIHPVHDVKELDDDEEGWISFHSVESYGCRSGKFAAVVRDEGKSSSGAARVQSEATLEFYSANGKLLWTKKMLPRGDTLNLVVSKNDERILYETRGTTDTEGDAMVALAADGEEKIFRYPNSFFSGMGISDNGRFAIVYVSVRERSPTNSYIRFYDLDTGKTHDFFDSKMGSVGRISDDGTAEIVVYPHPGRKGEKVIHRFKFE